MSVTALIFTKIMLDRHLVKNTPILKVIKHDTWINRLHWVTDSWIEYISKQGLLFHFVKSV